MIYNVIERNSNTETWKFNNNRVYWENRNSSTIKANFESQTLTGAISCTGIYVVPDFYDSGAYSCNLYYEGVGSSTQVVDSSSGWYSELSKTIVVTKPISDELYEFLTYKANATKVG